MVGTLLGGHMANALKRVEVESNIESERAQIHLQDRRRNPQTPGHRRYQMDLQARRKV